MLSVKVSLCQSRLDFVSFLFKHTSLLVVMRTISLTHLRCSDRICREALFALEYIRLEDGQHTRAILRCLAAQQDPAQPCWLHENLPNQSNCGG